ncbi:hypothetical protein [Actinomyces procaprae]|uniref:hypothetical protein n=1 Tax=Actinomyces procaprae TaxID=2560010 RepID=UPI00109E1DBC|nr:hypothetical protein [Actinomyces procaprae]
MGKTNALNAWIFGSDDDSLYLGDYDPDLDSKITGLYTAVPDTLVDCGWLSEDGAGMAFDDSVSEIKGHQGHKIVKTFMDSSKTTVTATLLEGKLDIVKRYLDVKATGRSSEESNGETKAVAKLTVPTSRKVIPMSGVLDLFDVSGAGVKIRIVLPHLELGERGELSFQTGEITGYEHQLTMLDDFSIWTDAPSLLPSA